MMTSKQIRSLRRVLEHKGFSSEEIEHELNNTSGQTGEARKGLTPRQVKRNAQRRRKNKA